MLLMENVEKVYRTEHVETHALSRFSVQVDDGRVRLGHGPVGLGQDDVSERRRSARHLRRWPLRARRSGRQPPRRRRAVADPQLEDRLHLPDLQPDPGPQRLRQRRRAAALSGPGRRRAAQGHRGGPGHRRPRLAHEAPPLAALRWPAAAGGHRPGPRRSAAADPRRRAHREPRLGHGQRDPRPDRGDQRRGHHGGHGHPRSGAGQPGVAPDPPARRQADRPRRRRAGSPVQPRRPRPPRHRREVDDACLPGPSRPAESSPEPGSHPAHDRGHRPGHRGGHDLRDPALHAGRATRFPRRATGLHYVQVDSWDPERPFEADEPEEPPVQLTHMDMVGLMESDIPTHAERDVQGLPHRSSAQRRRGPSGRACASALPTSSPCSRSRSASGRPGATRADRGPEPVVVLGHAINQRLFGGEDSVGRTLRIEDRDLRVVGVLEPWRPMPKFYDTHNGPFDEAEEIYMPFRLGTEMEVASAGNKSAWQPYPDDYEGFLQSEVVWIQMWVQLDTEEQRERYRAFLDAYVGRAEEAGPLPEASQQPAPRRDGMAALPGGRARADPGAADPRPPLPRWPAR